MKTYLSTLFFSSPVRCILILGLMLLLGATEGASLLLLIPLLQAAGFNTGTSLVLPHFISRLMVHYSAGLPLVLLFYFMILSGVSILKYYRSTLSAFVRENFTNTLREKLYRALIQSRYSFLSHQRDSDVLHVMTLETTRAGSATFYFFELLSAGCLVLTYMVFFLWVSFAFSCIAFVCAAFLFSTLRYFNYKVFSGGEKMVSSYQDFYRWMNDFFRCIKYSKSRHLQDDKIAQFNQLSAGIAHHQLRWTLFSSRTSACYTVLSVLLICVMFYCAIHVFALALASSLLWFTIYVRVVMKISSCQSCLQKLIPLSSAFTVVNQLRQKAEAAREAANVEVPCVFEKTVQFERVSFVANDTLILKSVSFVLMKNSLTVLLGPSGAGKTTCADVLAGLLQPTAGSVLVDGRPLANLRAWHDRLTYVSQSMLLQQLTVRENLGDESEDKLWQALTRVGVDCAIARLNAGLDTPLHRASLSGGEMQKIALARALLSKADVWILDEATSHLDRASSCIIATLLNELKHRITILMITHHVCDVLKPDQVLQLQDGELVSIDSSFFGEDVSWRDTYDRRKFFAQML